MAPGRHLDVLAQAGSRSALGAGRMIADWRAAEGAGAKELKGLCLTFARKILATWPERQHQDSYGVWNPTRESAEWPDPMTSLQRFDDPGLSALTSARRWPVTPRSSPAAVKAVARHGWETFRPEHLTLFRATTSNTISATPGSWNSSAKPRPGAGRTAGRRGGKKDGKKDGK